MVLYDKVFEMGQKFAKLISISDFSKGKTSNIFDDVKKNSAEYVVLKNNQPTGVVVSYEWYNSMKELLVNYKNIMNERKKTVVIGGGKGKLSYPKDFDIWDNEIAKMFTGVR